MKAGQIKERKNEPAFKRKEESGEEEDGPSLTCHQPPLKRKEPHGGCQVNGPKVAKFLDR